MDAQFSSTAVGFLGLCGWVGGCGCVGIHLLPSTAMECQRALWVSYPIIGIGCMRLRERNLSSSFGMSPKVPNACRARKRNSPSRRTRVKPPCPGVTGGGTMDDRRQPGGATIVAAPGGEPARPIACHLHPTSTIEGVHEWASCSDRGS